MSSFFERTDDLIIPTNAIVEQVRLDYQKVRLMYDVQYCINNVMLIIFPFIYCFGTLLYSRHD